METAATVLKALDVLTILAGRTDGLIVPELAQALDQPRTNVVRLLLTLQAYGLVERQERRWQTSQQFYNWVSSRFRHEELRRAYRPVLERVAAETRELVLLGLHEGNGVIHIDYIESDSLVRVAPAPATRHNLRHNALGKLALSRRPDLVRRIRDQRLQCELEEIRRTGVAWNRGETVPDMVALAVPGYTNAPTEPMIAVAWPAFRFTNAKAARAIRVMNDLRAAATRS